ncbi:hypothetical protein BsIDN1_57770 [Bacillus safensis]|uniref:3-hydroxyacyl-CoA dehydrogenase C-terminal domain-containing protein n=1 Tax=Bacillus safensis TaxID=561879 RepID=A0A5S9MJY0_BACIA|nr:hypothetical protein BsIDN1_57770 [Bacillus safensis]
MRRKKNYKGLVIGNQGKNFCVGANLALILMEAQDDNFFEIDFVIRRFQQAMMKVKYSNRPVVAAPFGMTLGGGTEVCLPAAAIQASSETYMGLVEAGVGLIPGGGGNKELYLRHLQGSMKPSQTAIQDATLKTFETIAMAKVSTSAEEARDMNMLRVNDRISMNGDHLIYDAQLVLSLDEAGYRAPLKQKVPVMGETGYAAMILAAENMRLSGYISEHDMTIVKN